MSLALVDRTIERVRLIDDNPEVRSGYRFPVEDMHLNPEEVTGPLGDLTSFLNSFDPQRDAVISDFQLNSGNYSPFNGDELVMRLYQRKLPVVMCTRYADVLPEPVRARRRYIPVVFKSAQLTSESLIEAFNLCANEYSEIFVPTRRPWRARVRIEGIEKLTGNQLRLNVVIPGWDLHTALSFDVPITKSNSTLEHLAKMSGTEDVISIFGTVNLGAERAEDIYIDEWSMERNP